ncbi:MAG: EamA family transporter [Candidatus Bipolaricaulota bacterium]
MTYFYFALIAMIAYSLVAPLVKLGTQEVPVEVAVVITNSFLLLFTIIWATIRRENVLNYLSLEVSSIYLYLAGLALGVGIISYYMALDLGAVSKVVPIFGLYIALSSVYGFFLLGEEVTGTKILGLALAVVAIVLVSR